MKTYIPIILVFTVLLSSACTQETSSTPSPTLLPIPSETVTPDPCFSENISASAKKVSDLQREFDDASALAANLPREQLPSVITDMQRIRRAAEDQETPACLITLRTYQLAHMNTVINTLIAFVGGADQTTLNEGITRARQEHDQYTIELARLLGITLPPTAIAPAETQPPTTPTP
jgi:hypothetical protein